MIKFKRSRIRKFLIPGAFFLLASITISVYSLAEEVLLTPPGLRPVKAPSLPAYRDASGNPADGWSGKYINTRRFVSNQSAWIYFRSSDFQRSVVTGKSTDKGDFRFWPVGTILVIESYKGNAFQSTKDQLVEIDVMVKVKGGNEASRQAFHPVNWAYARFKPDGKPSISKLRSSEKRSLNSSGPWRTQPRESTR